VKKEKLLMELHLVASDELIAGGSGIFTRLQLRLQLPNLQNVVVIHLLYKMPFVPNIM
jgi:hypothetical protein